MVLDECKRLVEDSSDKSQTKIEELNSEIRKLKAMIGIFHIGYWYKTIIIDISVKHETRIRTLETKNKEQEKALNSRGILLNNNGHTEMDPDEVWALFMELKLTKTILYNEVGRHFTSQT